MDEDSQKRFELMDREIRTVQVALSESSKPWYRNTSNWVSITALVFSFGTTFVSYRHTAVQDIDNKRQELRGLLQRLAALPRENVEVGAKYRDDPGSRNLVSGFLNQENTLLARNAAELAKKLPSGSVSAAEYYAVAVALQTSYDLTGANEFLDHSISTAPDFVTEIAALRMKGNMQFIQGHPEAGRVEYQKAMDIFSKYQSFDPYTKISTNVATELSWAYSEAGSNSFAQANQQIANAESIISPLPNSPGAAMLRSQISQAKSVIASGAPVTNPIAGSQFVAPSQDMPKK